MSEYQYYEFRAIDQALTPAQMKEVRGISTRAEVTNRSFSVTYSYSDFRGNPRRMMERNYDAHVYVSNFGNMILMLRLPLHVISDDAISPYASQDALDWWTTEEHIILEWQLNEDEGGDWVDGEGWIDRLVPLRDEFAGAGGARLYRADRPRRRDTGSDRAPEPFLPLRKCSQRALKSEERRQGANRR